LALYFLSKEYIGTKAALEMFLKLSSGINFSIILLATFAQEDPKSVFLRFCALIKAARKHVGEIDTRLINFIGK